VFRHADIRRYLAVAAVLAALLLAGWLLFFPPFIGVADNGDFSRLMRIAGFRYLDDSETYEERYFHYAHQFFGYKSNWGSFYVTSQVILLAVIGWVARLFHHEIFDIRWFGAVYTLLYAMAVYLVVRHAPEVPGRKTATAVVSAAIGLMVIFVLGDVGYLAYFQSFYGEPYAYAGMLLAAASALAMASGTRPQASLLFIYFAASFAVVTSKVQYAPLGLVFILLAWRIYVMNAGTFRLSQVKAGIAVLLAGTAVMLAAPNGLKQINLYQSVFFGILKDSPDLARDMRELGIPERYAVLAGTNYFQRDTAIPQDDPDLQREVLKQLSHMDVAKYYLLHPDRFIQKMKKAAENAKQIRPYYLGNYDRASGKPPRAMADDFSWWSTWKARHLPASLTFFACSFGLYFAAAAIWWIRTASRRMRLALETMAAVALAGVFSFVIPVLGDGEADLGKHLFMFNVCFDMMVLSAAAAFVYGIVRIAAAARR
jgi:hypothetical protein